MSDETAIHSIENGDFYQRLRQRIRAWLGSREGRTYRFADRLLQTILDVMEAAEEMVGERVWRRLQRMIGGGEW